MRNALGLLLAAVTIAASACASAPAPPPSVNVTGTWAGSWQYENLVNGSGTLRGTFKQDGANLSGNFNVTGPTRSGGVVNLIGFVQGNEVRLSQPASGTLTVTGNEMSGWVNGFDPAKVTLRRQ
jgi:hypothetical protein